MFIYQCDRRNEPNILWVNSYNYFLISQLQEFILFERNLMELSSLASKLPSDACKHPEVSNVTMAPNATSEDNTTTTTESPRVHHHHEQKKKKVSESFAWWRKFFAQTIVTLQTQTRKSRNL